MAAAASSNTGVARVADRLQIVEACERTEVLYRQYGDWVSRICRAIMRDRAEAEDATQQVFLSAHRALLYGAVPEDTGAWVATIARNECRSRLRERMWTPLAETVEAIDRLAPDPPVVAMQRIALAALWEEIADLPPAQREALLLREIRGLSYDQLSRTLGLTGPAVRSLLRRARQRLRGRFKEISTALGGFSWLETLLRLLSGATAPAVPVATKALAAGLGAAALAGGAVVAPEIVERHLHPVTIVRTAPPNVHALTRHRAGPQISLSVRSGDLAARHRQRGRVERDTVGGLRHDGRGPDDHTTPAVALPADEVSGGGPSSGDDGAHVSTSGDRSLDGTVAVAPSSSGPGGQDLVDGSDSGSMSSDSGSTSAGGDASSGGASSGSGSSGGSDGSTAGTTTTNESDGSGTRDGGGSGSGSSGG